MVKKLKCGECGLIPVEVEDDICDQCECPHSDARDHFICIDCGHEEDPGRAIDRAMDIYEEER
jgi:hypothetical protein